MPSTADVSLNMLVTFGLIKGLRAGVIADLVVEIRLLGRNDPEHVQRAVALLFHLGQRNEFRELHCAYPVSHQ